MGAIAVLEKLSHSCAFEVPIAVSEPFPGEAAHGSAAEFIIAESIAASAVIGITTAGIAGADGLAHITTEGI